MSSENILARKYSQNNIEWMNLDLSGGHFADVDLTRIRTARFMRALKVLVKEESPALIAAMFENSLHQYSIFSAFENVMNTRIIMSQQDETHLYVVMEFPLCDNLFMVMRRLRCLRMAEPRAVKYILQLAIALRFLKRHDETLPFALMPENVVLTAWDDVKLSDFGYTPYRGSAKRPGLAIEYRGPESLQQSKESQYVWALGILFYEMVVSVTPFQHLKLTERDIRMMDMTVKFPEFLADNTMKMILQMLSVDPNERIDLNALISTDWMWRVTIDRNRMLADIYKGLRFIEPTLQRPEKVTTSADATPTNPSLPGSLYELRKRFERIGDERIGDEPIDTKRISLAQALTDQLLCPEILVNMSCYARIRMKSDHQSNLPLNFARIYAYEPDALECQYVKDDDDMFFAADECDEDVALEAPANDALDKAPVQNATENVKNGAN